MKLSRIYNPKKRGKVKMRSYEQSFRIEAVKLAKEIGTSRAAKELGIPDNTLSTWIYRDKRGELEPGATPQSSLTLAQENKRLEREIREVKRANQILKEAMAFFVESQKKSKRS